MSHANASKLTETIPVFSVAMAFLSNLPLFIVSILVFLYTDFTFRLEQLSKRDAFCPNSGLPFSIPQLTGHKNT